MNATHTMPGFFQLAHVTTSLDQAIADVGDAMGITNWLEMRDHAVVVKNGERAKIHVALAWKDSLMIELIEPFGGADAIYRDALGDEPGYRIRQHHLGRMFDTAEQFEAAMAPLRQQGIAFPIEGGFAETNGKCLINYADLRPQLGYYIENLMFTPEGRGWLDTVPRK